MAEKVDKFFRKVTPIENETTKKIRAIRAAQSQNSELPPTEIDIVPDTEPNTPLIEDDPEEDYAREFTPELELKALLVSIQFPKDKAEDYNFILRNIFQFTQDINIQKRIIELVKKLKPDEEKIYHPNYNPSSPKWQSHQRYLKKG